MKNKLSAIKLNHDSYIALHTQLHNVLRQLIVSGRWQYGERIPSEPQLAKHLDISRSTVRIALQKAEVEGLIKRAAGRGTFVSYDSDERTNNRFIGYVTRSFHNEIHRILLSSVETELRSEGYNIVFSNAVNNDEEVRVLEQLLQDNVQGVILWANANVTAGQQAILQEYHARNIPIVFIDRFVEGVSADYIASDNLSGTYHLVKHLIELGHRQLVFLTHNISNLFPVEERYRGFIKALQEQGLEAGGRWEITSPHETEFFETDIFQLLDDQNAEFNVQISQLFQDANPKPSAIVCVNDAVAILAMRAMQSLGLKVPDDISIVGFDDISLAAYLDVPLTTASQNAHEIGQRAAEMLLERLDGYSKPPREIAVPTRLQIRMSTSTPSAKHSSLALPKGGTIEENQSQ